ncbi:hypothetical protein WJX75_006614 [Coccomyxa subellipsoidea]|uniref:Protein kinase domain-containing protein n=1 Tax=Coccomyxa subellipsoidea TaxID=248742 RepID=A0ABR2YR30_9CHLO
MAACDILSDRSIDHYDFLRGIGDGSHGEVYLGKHKETGEEVAIKLGRERRTDVLYEAKVYRALQGEGARTDEFSDVKHYGIQWNGDAESRAYIIMGLLGPNLEELFDFCSNSFHRKTVLMLADQLITRLEYVHSKGYVHCSVKPENFATGIGKKVNQVHIIDFCKARRCCNAETGTHNPYRDTRLGYMLMYYLRGSLPWQKGYLGLNTKQMTERLRSKMLATDIDSLCSGFPEEFAEYLKYCRCLRFDEQPDYSLLRLKRDGRYTWILVAQSLGIAAKDKG